jgi:hypothetical protein
VTDALIADVHPIWCSPTYCGVTDPNLPTHGGEHRSEPIVLDLRLVMTNYGALSATGKCSAYLTQAACPWTTSTYLHLETAGRDITQPVGQAAGVLLQLQQLIDQAT